ncbi:MAG: DUF1800 family protein [Maricaulaceae bacterium]
MSTRTAAIALTRFGMGARPAEIAAIAQDPQGALQSHLDAPEPLDAAGLKSGAEAAAESFAYFARRRERLRQNTNQDGVYDPDTDENFPEDTRREIGRLVRATLGQEVSARTRHAMTTPTGFHERLVRFWSNHFTVAATTAQTLAITGPYEREAIRPHVTGRFADLLSAVVRHPGMLVYLDNIFSVGPNSRAGRRIGRGLNENLAREILELHTLGVDGGYDQADVEAFARALTGWSVGNPRFGQARMGQFVFAAPLHEPGPQTVLGKRYAEDGEAQAQAILDDLARHPATARTVATKLARHFIADAPPAGAIARLEAVFLETDGDLKALSLALLDEDAAWDQALSKMKTPEEFFLSAGRALDIPTLRPEALTGVYRALGQRPFGAPSPKGWPDDAESWAGPDALMKRLEWSSAAAQRVGGRDPKAWLDTALGPLASEATRLAVSRAESREQGLTLALMSPEFQRR